MMPTTLSKKLRRKIAREYARYTTTQYDDQLAERARLKAYIERHTINGKVGIDWDKMDCDCVRWGGHSHIPATVMHFIRWENDFYDGAEGPQRAHLCRPEHHTGKQWERDLAFEAHEDGHPHVVYA